jgi:hypothetical protein
LAAGDMPGRRRRPLIGEGDSQMADDGPPISGRKRP